MSGDTTAVTTTRRDQLDALTAEEAARQADRDRQRVVVREVVPAVLADDGGRAPVKRVPGEHVDVAAKVFTDGHDLVRAVVQHATSPFDPDDPAGPDGTGEVVMTSHPLPHDHHTATFRAPDEPGWAWFRVVAWVDRFGTWHHDLSKKLEATGPSRADDLDVHLRFGARLAREFLEAADDDEHAATLRDALALLEPDDDADPGLDRRIELGLSDGFETAMRALDTRRFATVDGAVELDVIPARGGFSSWYELFPRSASPDPDRHGTLRDVIDRLPYVASMGFDVLYLPPIHPIGRVKRKGRNNTLDPEPDDLGVPWAIGAEEGGHLSVHPELGTVDDVVELASTARERFGIELAMDIALQCAPDHPWVAEHPEWFVVRPDGSIQFAENPPKKYEDIVPFAFEGPDNAALWDALKGVFDFWIDKGVRTFRVDNPHTKAFPFWDWCIRELRKEHGHDLVFLAEAFSRQNIQFRLARGGYTQGYTYFAWKQAKWELEQYLAELTQGPAIDFFRPNAWPNTPDILTEQLQHGNRSTFISRLVLAGTLFANWGMYGPTYELLVNVAREPGSEEYLDSEKYQRRTWNLDASWSIRNHVAVVNRIRREHPALHNDRSLRFHRIDNDQLMAYSKRDRDTGDTMLMVVSLDQQWTQAGWVHLDLGALGIRHHGPFEVMDELTGRTFGWEGSHNFVQLDPGLPAHVLHVRHG